MSITEPSVHPIPGMPRRVDIWEVGPRDGLQNEAVVVPTAVKAEFVSRLVAAGLRTVETSSFANVPPTKTCMNCHSQIWVTSPTLEPVRASFRDGKSLSWTRVNDLPDFVYFNHGIHVNKGVGCETCHGRVDKMPLMAQANTLQMEWCLNCHRNTEKYIRPREFVTTMGYQPAGDQEEIGRRLQNEYNIQDVRTLTSCSTCHR